MLCSLEPTKVEILSNRYSGCACSHNDLVLQNVFHCVLHENFIVFEKRWSAIFSFLIYLIVFNEMNREEQMLVACEMRSTPL